MASQYDLPYTGNQVEILLGEVTQLKNAMPEKVSDLPNDSGYITAADLPTKTSDLTNDSGFITNAPVNAEAARAQAAEALLATIASLQAEITRATGVEGTLQGLIDGIEAKIPLAASGSNQLADKSYVNASIATASATFRGTYTSLVALQAVAADENDYGYVISTDAVGNTIYNRYKYANSTWTFEYAIANPIFDSSQWAAINSAVTAELVAKLSALPDNATLTAALAAKQDVIDDLSSIRSKADSAYQKPSGGIPASDIADGVIPDIADNLITNDATKVLSAKQGKVLNENLAQLGQEVDRLYDGAEIIKSTNLYNKDADGCVINKYVSYLTGSLLNATGSKASDYIPVIAGNNYRANLHGQMAWYDSDKVFISGFVDFNTTRQAPANAAYMRVSIAGYAANDATAQVNDGNTLRPYEPYYEKIRNLNWIATPNSVGTSVIEDDAVTTEKINGAVSYSTNLYDKNAPGCVVNKYVNYTTGGLSNSSGAKASDYIPVTPGQYYIASPGGMMAFYNASKVYISGYDSLGTKRLAPENAAYLRFTIGSYATTDATAQVNESETLLPYEPYHKYKKNTDLITTPDKEVVTDIVNTELSNGIEKRLNPGFIKVTSASITQGQNLRSLYYPYYTRLGEQITMFAYVSSWGAGIKIGKYIANNYGSGWIEIDGTNIVAKNFLASESTIATISHGLTIQTYVKVVIRMDADKWVVILQTLSGTFKTDISLVDGLGVATIESLGASLTSIELSCTNSYFDKPIWAFGDSYYGMNATIRQLYWLREWGYLDFFVNSKAGINSATSLLDLRKALAIGKPKYLIWSLGMNDTTFDDWKASADQVVDICEDNGITLILTTIPQPASTAVHDKDDISDWIRNSGIRYIDAAKAVGSDENGHWYGYGTAYDYQSDDNVHCSEYGAKAIATQFLIDVPEIMQ